MTAVRDYCPACDERTALVDSGLCPFCDTPLIAKARRGGWKRPDLRGGKYTDAQLRALYRAHLEGASIRQLAIRTYEKVGYTSHHSAAQAISDAWKRLGLPARDRIAATRLASTKHGLAPKHGPRPGYGTYKRRLHQPDQPKCAAIKSQHPRKGKPCQRPAMHGSDYCVSHDPQRTLERQANLAKMRRRQPERDMLPLEPFALWLHELRHELGSFTKVAERIGMHHSAVCRLAKRQESSGRPKTQIGREVIERCAAAGGTTIDAIYIESERAAA